MPSWNAPAGGTDPHPDRAAYSRSGFAHPDSVDHLAVPVNMADDDDTSSTCSLTSDSDRDPLRQRRHRRASTWRQRCTRRARRIPPMAAILLAMAAILLLTAAHLTVSATYETIKYQQRHNDPNTLCNTEHHDDCYPREFVPTSEYTVIREGQVLPPGLDIRFDWATGERWAKLPAKSDADENGAVVVVPGTEREEVPLGGRRRGRARPTPAAAARSGPIQADDDLNEPQVLMLAARIVGNIPLTHGEWAALESAAHDIETGTTIAKALHPTLGALAERYLAQTTRKPATVANAHAAVQFFRTVGNALQNNPRAIEALDKKADPPLVPILVAAIDWHVTAVPGMSDEHAHAAVAQACVHALGALVRGDEVYVRALVELGGTRKVESWRDLATTAALVRKVEHLLEDLTALVDPGKSEGGVDASVKNAEGADVGSVEDPAVSPSADAGASV